MKGAYLKFSMSVCLSVHTVSDKSCITATRILIILILCRFINILQRVPNFDYYRIRIMKTIYEELLV